MKRIDQFFSIRKGYGVIFIRLIISWRLLAGVWPYITQTKPISEVKDYFMALQLPMPFLAACVSVYAQFICGILIMLGLWLRPAAILMIINFSIAILAAHINDSIEKSFAPWIILACSLFFLFNGAGKISLDERITKEKTNDWPA